MNCPICLDTVKIPSQLTCFPCFHKTEIHCFSMIRLCFSCAVKYMFLHQSKHDRPYSVKCLFCPEICNPRKLTIKNTIEIDFYATTLCREFLPKTCPFCCNDVENILSHLKDCPYLYTECPCGFVTFQQLQKFHQSNCYSFQTCRVCSKRVPKTSYFDHLLYDHDVMECVPCNQLIHYTEYLSHELHKCPYRLIHCQFCHTTLQHNEYEKHLENHLIQLQKISHQVEHMTKLISLEKTKEFPILRLTI